MIIANATGCSSIYGASAPSMPYNIPWASSLSIDNVKKISIENGYIGTAPEHRLASIYSSDDVRDIELNLDFLKLSIVKLSKYEIYGGSYQTITYICDNKEEYSLVMMNGYVVFNDLIAYQMINDIRPDIKYAEKVNEVNLMSRYITADYGFHIKDKVTFLLYDSLIPQEIINHEHVRVPLVVGDQITIKYTGQIISHETYPSTLDLSKASIKGVIFNSGFSSKDKTARLADRGPMVGK